MEKVSTQENFVECLINNEVPQEGIQLLEDIKNAFLSKRSPIIEETSEMSVNREGLQP